MRFRFRSQRFHLRSSGASVFVVVVVRFRRVLRFTQQGLLAIAFLRAAHSFEGLTPLVFAERTVKKLRQRAVASCCGDGSRIS